MGAPATEMLLGRAVDVALPGSRLRSAAALAGGNFTSVWRLDAELPDAISLSMVARISRANASVDIHRILPLLSGQGIPVPGVIWTGALDDGRSVVLLEFLEGESVGHELPLADRIRELAVTLAAVHGVDRQRLGPLAPFPLLPTTHLRSWISPHPLAKKALAALDVAAPLIEPEPDVLVHGDYWSGNILWDGGRIVGLLDWDNAARGPRASDVAKCRLDLALRFGTEAADELQVSYERYTQLPLADQPYWDLRLGIEGMPDPRRWWLPTYQTLGVSDLSSETVRQRYDSYLERVLQPFG